MRKFIFLLPLLMLLLSATGVPDDNQQTEVFFIKNIHAKDSIKQVTIYAKSQITQLEYKWDVQNNDWDEFKKIERVRVGLNRTSAEYEWNVQQKKWQGVLKIETEFGADSLVKSITNYVYDSLANDWQSAQKESFESISDGTKTIVRNYYWDKDNKQWKQIVAYMYDQAKVRDINVTTKLIERNEAWFPFALTEKNKNLNASYIWDSVGGVWLGTEKFAFKRNKKDDIVSAITYKSYDSKRFKWIPTLKDEIVYNENGRISFQESFVYDAKASKWIKSQRTEFRYEDNKIMQVSNEWNDSLKTWIPTERKESLTKDGLEKANILYLWLPQTQSWMNSTKTEREYQFGKLTFTANYSWDKTLSAWKGTCGTRIYYRDGKEVIRYGVVWNLTSGKWSDE